MFHLLGGLKNLRFAFGFVLDHHPYFVSKAETPSTFSIRKYVVGISPPSDPSPKAGKPIEKPMEFPALHVLKTDIF